MRFEGKSAIVTGAGRGLGQAIVFDLPSVAVVAREFIDKHGLSDRIRAVGGDFTRDALPPGADGELMARAPMVTRGYYRQPELTAIG